MLDSRQEQKSSKSIGWGTVLGYIGLALSIVSGLLFTPWIKEAIGKSDYGIYTLSTSLVNIFLLDFGLSATANTFLARYQAEKDEEGARNFLAVIYRLFLIVDALVLIAFVFAFFCIDSIYVGLTAEERESLRATFLIAAGFSVVSFPCTIFSGVLQAYEKFISIKLIDIVQRLFFIGASALCIVFDWGLIGLVSANFLSALLCHILRYLIIRFSIKIKANFRYKANKAFVKRVLFYSGWAAVQSIASRLVFNIMPSILGIVSNTDEITTFSFISQLEGYVYMFGSVMGGFFLPKIARLKQEENSREKLDKLAVTVGKVQFFFVGLIFAGFMACGKDFIFLWLKDDPDTDVIYIGTLIIIAYQLVFVPEMVFYNEMFISDFVRPLAIGSLIKAALNCGLAFLLGHFYGAMGAAISVAVSRVFELVYINCAYRTKLRASLKTFFSKTYLATTPALVLSALAGLLISWFVPLNHLPRLILSGCSVIVIFGLFYWFVGTSKDERAAAKSFLAAKRRKQ